MSASVPSDGRHPRSKRGSPTGRARLGIGQRSQHQVTEASLTALKRSELEAEIARRRRAGDPHGDFDAELLRRAKKRDARVAARENGGQTATTSNRPPLRAIEPDDETDDLGFASYVLPVTDEGRETEPALLTTSDGQTLFYQGRVNSLFGQPCTCKTWIAMLAARQAMEQDLRVLWWDHEDTPATLAARARTLGALAAFQDPERFAYVLSSIIGDAEAMRQAVAWVSGGLVVIDAAESAGCPSDGAPINEWWCQHVTPWREASAGVLILDHEPKRKEGRALSAIGSTHKLSRIDGASIRVAASEGGAWTKTKDGKVIFVVAKDRPGDVGAVRKVVAVATGSYDHNGAFQLDLRSPARDDEADEEHDADTEDRDIADEILAALVARAPKEVRGKRQLRKLATGGNGAIDQALEDLIDDGLVERRWEGKTQIFKATPEATGIASLLESTSDDPGHQPNVP